MLAFVQKHQGEFANISTLSAYLGFCEKGFEVRFFEYPQLPFSHITKETPVIGGIPVVVSALSHLGVTVPEVPSIPKALQSFAGRHMWKSTMQEARNEVSNGRSIFVKPSPVDRKLFAGQVFKHFHDTIATAHIPPDYIVVCSEVVDFVSEYRAFVLDTVVLGLRHYKGDFRVFPDAKLIDKAVAAYLPAPIAYGIDFGVTNDGRTLLVETNEAYSLGSYGLAPILYSSLIERRWLELTGEL